MRYFNNGGFFTVTASASDIEGFDRQWPCSGLEDRPLTAQFDASNGDLVDCNDETNHPHADGAALLALLEDMQEYGANKHARAESRTTR